MNTIRKISRIVMVGGWIGFLVFSLLSQHISRGVWDFAVALTFGLYWLSVVLAVDYLWGVLRMSHYWLSAHSNKKALTIVALLILVAIIAIVCFLLLFIAYFNLIYPGGFHI